MFLMSARHCLQMCQFNSKRFSCQFATKRELCPHKICNKARALPLGPICNKARARVAQSWWRRRWTILTKLEENRLWEKSEFFNQKQFCSALNRRFLLPACGLLQPCGIRNGNETCQHSPRRPTLSYCYYASSQWFNWKSDARWQN